MKKVLWMVLVLASANAFADIQTGIDGRNAGDVIAVRTDSQIAAWCDFGKTIVTTQFHVLCVYNGSKKTASD